MSLFIQMEDYGASIHQEILDSVTRGDSSLIDICEGRAISEMRSLLSARYDCDIIFSQKGDQRHALILMYAIDITIYHLFCMHNPRNLSKIREDRYNRAIEHLRDAGLGKLPFEGVPLLEPKEREQNAPVRMISNPKRNNRL